MPLNSSSLSKIRDGAVESFTTPNPFLPQVIIGVCSVVFRPWIIASNKNEKLENRVNASARTLVREGMALPIALITAGTAGWAGSKLATHPINKLGIAGAATFAGFAIANTFIPSLTTKVLHKLPIKEKIQAMAMKRTEEPIVAKTGKLDVVSKSPEMVISKTRNPNKVKMSELQQTFLNIHTKAEPLKL